MAVGPTIEKQKIASPHPTIASIAENTNRYEQADDKPAFIASLRLLNMPPLSLQGISLQTIYITNTVATAYNTKQGLPVKLPGQI